MNAQTHRFLGLELSNDGSYFQIRLRKPNFVRLGHGVREFLLVSCVLLSISLVTLVTIVWVVTTLAEVDSSLASESNRLTSSRPQLSHTVRHSLSRIDFR